jgi:hypothetical protein
LEKKENPKGRRDGRKEGAQCGEEGRHCEKTAGAMQDVVNRHSEEEQQVVTISNTT